MSPLPLSVNYLIPLNMAVMLTVFFVMTRGIVVPLTTPSHKSLKLVYIDNQLVGITIPNQILVA